MSFFGGFFTDPREDSLRNAQELHIKLIEQKWKNEMQAQQRALLVLHTVQRCSIPGYSATACPCCRSREFVNFKGVTICGYCRVTQEAQPGPRPGQLVEYRHRPLMK